MALDLPPTPNCPQEIDAQVVLPLFQQMYSKAKTRRGFIMNILRLFTSPLFLLPHLIFASAWGWVATLIGMMTDNTNYEIRTSAIVALVLLNVLSLPAVIIGFVICVLIPFSFCVCPALCCIFSPYCRYYRTTSAL